MKLKLLGTINGIQVYTSRDNPQEDLDLAYMPESILQKIKTYAQKTKEIKSSLLKFALDEVPEKKYILKEYEKYIQYLLQLCTKRQLKDFCKEYLITNYSKFKKEDLINHILINLNGSEKASLILKYELPLLAEEVKEAIKILTHQSNEKGKIIRLDDKRKDIEMDFTAERYTTSAYLSLQERELNDPYRDCDCVRGSLGGFCRHFWVCLAVMISKDLISLDKWSLTKIPQNFLSLIKKIHIYRERQKR